MTDKLISARQNQKNSSIFCAIKLVTDHHANEMLGCENSDCLITSATLKLCMMHHDPDSGSCICTGRSGSKSIFDCQKSRPQRLRRFSLFQNSHKYWQSTSRTIGHSNQGRTRQRCGMRNAQAMKAYFRGDKWEWHIQGFQLFEYAVDVVVCDGFFGNILLKSIESMAQIIKGYIQRRSEKIRCGCSVPRLPVARFWTLKSSWSQHVRRHGYRSLRLTVKS
jgi:fatty acid/phospholipid biosynthesis enzyme